VETQIKQVEKKKNKKINYKCSEFVTDNFPFLQFDGNDRTIINVTFTFIDIDFSIFTLLLLIGHVLVFF
jgi:hypothetical protein